MLMLGTPDARRFMSDEAKKKSQLITYINKTVYAEQPCKQS